MLNSQTLKGLVKPANWQPEKRLTITGIALSFQVGIIQNTVPAKRTGSCGMMDSFLRRSSSPIFETSTPSTKIVPPKIS